MNAKKTERNNKQQANKTIRVDLTVRFYICKQNRNRNKPPNILTTELRTEIGHITQKEQRHIAGPLIEINTTEQEKRKYLLIYKMKSEI